MSTQRETTVGEIMRTRPVTLGRDDTLYLLDDIMTLGRIRHLPVLHERRLVGVVTQRDILRSALMTAMGFKARLRKTLLKAVRVKDVMSRRVITVSPNATVKEAAKVMATKKIGCLPVVEAENLVGLITETDILRYVATR